MTQSRERKRSGSLLLLLFGFTGGHWAWTFHLLVGYFLGALDCVVDYRATLFLTAATVVALAVAVAAGAVSWRIWRDTRTSVEQDVGGAVGRRGFMALSGVFLSVLFSAIIVVEAIGILYLQPCVALVSFTL